MHPYFISTISFQNIRTQPTLISTKASPMSTKPSPISPNCRRFPHSITNCIILSPTQPFRRQSKPPFPSRNPSQPFAFLPLTNPSRPFASLSDSHIILQDFLLTFFGYLFIFLHLIYIALLTLWILFLLLLFIFIIFLDMVLKSKDSSLRINIFLSICWFKFYLCFELFL